MQHMKKYLVVRASGGLSNRLQAVLGGIAYCLLTGRTLCVDWRDGLYSDDFSNVFPLWFQVHGIDVASCQEVEAAFHAGASVSPSFWKDYLCDAVAVEYLFTGDTHMSAQGRETSSYNIADAGALNQHEAAPDIAVHWEWTFATARALVPALQKRFTEYAALDEDAVLRALLQKHISPTVNVQQEIHQFYTQNFTQPPLGIHIRHSDLQSPLPHMMAALQSTYTQGDEIFLCTDNELVEKMVRRLYPQCITREKIFQGVNIPLHNYVPGISNVQKGFDAVVEMLLLAKCKHIIHFKRSSFARIPIYFSNLSPEQIHVVQ